MYIKRVSGPRHVTLPDGTIQTRGRPAARRHASLGRAAQAVVVQAVEHGLIPRAEVLERYGLSEEEFACGRLRCARMARRHCASPKYSNTDNIKLSFCKNAHSKHCLSEWSAKLPTGDLTESECEYFWLKTSRDVAEHRIDADSCQSERLLHRSGRDGIDLAKLYDYDLILLDLNLPDMSGHEVLRQLRPARIETPILILSGSDDTDNKIRGFGFGADDYLTNLPPRGTDRANPCDHPPSKGHAQAVIRPAASA